MASLHWDRYLDLNGWALVEGFEETEFTVGGRVFGTIQYLQGNHEARWQPDAEFSTQRLADAFLNVERAALDQGYRIGPATPRDIAIDPNNPPHVV